MKVVHISTSDSGGAGKAALRLHKGLLREGVDSKFLCLHKRTQEKETYQYQGRKPLTVIQKALRKAGVCQNRVKLNEMILKKLPESSEMFSFPTTDYNVLGSVLVSEADIVNLHWIAEYVDYHSFFSGVHKPIVWTLHDKNPALGGFHLLSEKERLPSFAKLEREIAMEKQEILNGVKKLDVVAPSNFLLSFSKQSSPLARFNHHLILNSVDTTVFKPYEQGFARKVFGIAPEKKAVLFLNSANYHKGTDFIKECINTHNFDNVQFIALGLNGFSHPSVVELPMIDDERLMSLLYSSVDLLLLPSREDNLPNMMLEALACGTPVLGFPTGGICDVITDGVTGFVTKELSAASIISGIQLFLKSDYLFKRGSIRNFSIDNFDISVQAKKYKDLYKSVLSNSLSS